MTAGADRRRALGLVMQLVGALSCVDPLRVMIAPERAFGSDRGHRPLALAVIAVLQIAIGWIVARRPVRARVAALGFVVVAIGAAIWALAPHELPAGEDGMETVLSSSPTLIHIVATLVELTIWPIVVLALLWRAPAGEPEEIRRRPEAGGVLIAYGGSMLATAALGAIGIVLVAGKSWNPYPPGLVAEMIVGRVVEAGVALLALRAGIELVMGTQHGRARITTFVWAAAILLSLATVADVALVAVLGFGDDTGARVVAFALVGIAGKLAVPLLVRAHAGPIARSAIEVGAPDPDGAVRPLFHLLLWFGVAIAAKLPSLFDRHFHAADLIAVAVALLLIVACAAAFREFARRGKRERRVAVVLGILASALLAFAVGFGLLHGALGASSTMAFLVAFAVVPWLIVWLERPSLRGQRGLGSVFE